MANSIKLEITGKDFTDTFDDKFVSINYTTNILLNDTLDLDTLDIQIRANRIDFEKYYNSLGSIYAVLTLGDYKASFFNISQVNPIGFSDKSINYYSFRMTTFPKKTAKVYDKDYFIYQEGSLFKIFERIMQDNSIPSSAYELTGEDTVLPLNEIKEDGISQLSFLRMLCFNYGYGIVSRDGKIRLIDLDTYSGDQYDRLLDFNDSDSMKYLVDVSPNLNFQPILEFIQVVRNDPNKLYFKKENYQNDAYFRDVFNLNAEYISVQGIVPLTTIQKKVNTLFRNAQQQTRTLSLMFSNYVPIFAGSIMRIQNYEPFFDRDYLVSTSSFKIDSKGISTSVNLIQKYNKQEYNVTFDQFVE